MQEFKEYIINKILVGINLTSSMMQTAEDYIYSKLQILMGVTQSHGISLLVYLVMVGIVAGISILSHLGIKFVISPLIRKWFNHSKSIYFHVIAKNKTLNAFAHLVGATVFFVGIEFVKEQSTPEFGVIQTTIHYLATLYIFLSVMFIISYLIWSINAYYNKKFDFSNQYPIYSYLKVVMIIAWSIWAILIIAYFANTSPLALLTGIGAISAVFLLVFRDTLLGIVASIQVTAANIVRIGDRITLDKYAVDGEVMDIAITTVKVRNADNTIATIPTYSLISEVVKNWRGMVEVGGRRIKRPINLDINSIMACDPDMLRELSGINAVNKYIDNHPGEELINLALYREYVMEYLATNPQINHQMVTIVRHLDPGLSGLPLEIYTFTKDTTFIGYETAQADIFEHCFSALGKFKLKILQYTSNAV